MHNNPMENVEKKKKSMSLKISKINGKTQKRITPLAQYWDRFKLDNEPPVTPLSIDIHKDIERDIKELNLPITPSQVKAGLNAYTKSDAYLKALMTIESRFNLLGEKAGSVNEEVRLEAKKRLEERWRQRKEQAKKKKQLGQKPASQVQTLLKMPVPAAQKDQKRLEDFPR